jgi:hypothetical protein
MSRYQRIMTGVMHFILFYVAFWIIIIEGYAHPR